MFRSVSQMEVKFKHNKLIAVNKDESMVQLKLALAWNRIDVAKSEIFLEDRKWEVSNVWLESQLLLFQCNLWLLGAIFL